MHKDKQIAYITAAVFTFSALLPAGAWAAPAAGGQAAGGQVMATAPAASAAQNGESAPPAAAAVVIKPENEQTVLEKTVAVETALYGAAQTGSLVDRINALQKAIYGAVSKDALVTKLDMIYNYTLVNGATTPSLVAKVNATEWSLAHDVTAQPVKARVENMEKTLLGNPATGDLDSRVNKLVQLAFPDGQLPVISATIPADTLVKIAIQTDLDSSKNRVGDPVVYQAVDDVYVNGVLVIPKGAVGAGHVSKVEQAKNFGRDGKLEIAFDGIGVIDGGTVPVFLGDKAKQETASLAKTAGATVVGMALLGPIGIIGGAFVHGQDIHVTPGSQMYVQTKGDTPVYGLQTQ